VNRVLAGIFEPDGARAPERSRERVRRALAGEGDASLHADDRLTLAWTGGGEPAAAPGARCLLDGIVYEPRWDERALAAAWAGEGEAALTRLRGDFAVILWEPETGRGILARDQIGGRSLVYAVRDGALLFATEVRNLLAMLDRRPAPDDAALTRWLALERVPRGATFYEGVRRLGPAELLPLEARPAPRRWWRPEYRPPLRASRAEIVERLRGALENAVARRSEGARRAAVLLSGGLDSSAVAAFGAPAAAYSAVFPEHPSIDESALVDLLTDELALPGTRIAVRGGSVIAGSLEYLMRWELPPVSPNLFFWMPLLRRAAQDGTDVMLDGEGGDEVFGLSPGLIADRVLRGRLVSAFALTGEIPGAGPHPPLSSRLRLLRRYGVRDAAPPWLHRAVRRRRGAGHYAPEWFTDAAARAHFAADRSAEWKAADGPRWWAWLAQAAGQTEQPALVFDHVRRRTALAGLEARHPLVDVDVIELMLSAAPELSYDVLHSRPLLRECLAGLLPDEVRLRPQKSTFDALFQQCLAGTDLPAVRRLLGPDAEVSRWIRLDVLRRALLDAGPPDHAGARRVWASNVWRTVTAECWLRFQRDPDELSRLVRFDEPSQSAYSLSRNPVSRSRRSGTGTS
jgi:asparagine synthase (glutamine-hydrolysing)